MHPPRCPACERAVYGGAIDRSKPCGAAYSLFHEVNDHVAVKKTHEENVAALEDFVTYRVTKDMITFIAQQATDVIPCDPNAATSSTPIPMLEYFIASVVEQSHCQVPTLMTSLVFLARLKDRLPQIAQGLPCTRHRLFLAALILAAKYVNDSSPKNKHWAIYSHIKNYPEFGFSLTEVNLMEKQLLYLLDWDLIITQSDLLTHFEPFLAQVRWDRASLRLEKELARRELLIDEDAQLPVPQFCRAAPPKGTKPPTALQRERAHADGLLYPDEERHLFLLSKCDREQMNAKIWGARVGSLKKKVTVASPALVIDKEDPYLLTKFIEPAAEYEESAEIYSYSFPRKASQENRGIYTLESDPSMESFDRYTAYENIQTNPKFPVEMSRTSTQDSYMSNNSSRFNSVSREVTPASSMTSLSGDDIDYSCHDDEDQVDVFFKDLNSASNSANPSPVFQYQGYYGKLPSTNVKTPLIANTGAAKRTMESRIPRPRSRRDPYNKSLSPQVRAHERQTTGSSQRVSPTQRYTGVGKRVKAAESSSMARIRKTLQGLDGENGSGDGARPSKRSRFLPRFLGGSTN